MATDATGTPTPLGIPTYDINVDAPSGNGFNAAMSEIDTLLQARATLASPALTGTPTAPTPATADNTTKIATTAFVKAQGYLTSSVTTFNGRSGAVVPASGDYSASQVTHAADLSSVSQQTFSGTISTGPTAVAPGGGGVAGFAADTSGRVLSVATGAGTAAFQASLTTDTQARFNVDHAGNVSWGPGGASATDTSLGRSGSGILTLAGGLEITGNVGFFGTTPVAKQTALGALGFVKNQVTGNEAYGQSTWTGQVGTTAYTVGDIVAALKNLGLIAA